MRQMTMAVAVVVVPLVAACGASGGVSAPAVSASSGIPVAAATMPAEVVELAPYCHALTTTIAAADPMRPTFTQVGNVKVMLDRSGVRAGVTGRTARMVERYYTETVALAGALFGRDQARVARTEGLWSLHGAALVDDCNR